MPAPHARAGGIWYAFSRTVSRRSAVIPFPDQSCHCQQREGRRCERISDTLIAHYRTCVIRRAAPAASDRRVDCLLLNTGAGSLEEIYAFIADPYWCTAGACGPYHPRIGLAKPNQSATIWPSFTHTHQQAPRPTVSRRSASIARLPHVWHERNQAVDVYCISAKRDSNAAPRRHDHLI